MHIIGIGVLDNTVPKQSAADGAGAMSIELFEWRNAEAGTIVRSTRTRTCCVCILPRVREPDS
jgi:hypothetical protein